MTPDNKRETLRRAGLRKQRGRAWRKRRAGRKLPGVRKLRRDRSRRVRPIRSRQRRFQQRAEPEREIQRRKRHREVVQIRLRNLNLGGSHMADAVRHIVVVVRMRMTIRVGVVRVNPACLLQQRVRRGRQPQGQQQNRHNCFQPSHAGDATNLRSRVQPLCQRVSERLPFVKSVRLCAGCGRILRLPTRPAGSRIRRAA